MATQTKKKRPNFIKRFFTWVGRSWAELKKVSWPTPKQVVKNLGIVLVVVLFFLITVGAADLLFSWLLGLLTSVGA